MINYKAIIWDLRETPIKLCGVRFLGSDLVDALEKYEALKGEFSEAFRIDFALVLRGEYGKVLVDTRGKTK